LYTGNNNNGQAVTGVGFQPDFVWIKQRTTAVGHNLEDAVRGAGKFLQSETSAAEDITGNLVSFDSDGFTVGTGNRVDQGTNAYVAWNWKANGSGVSNTDGSITSTVSANTESGFSIVSYTGTGSAATVGHGLDAKPDWIVIKRRDSTSNWLTAHVGAGTTGDTISGYDESFMLYLDATNAKTNNTTEAFALGDSSVFAISTADIINANTGTYIAYCFHSVEGFSKFGSFELNNNADGPFVYLGFRPAFVITRRIDGAGDWNIFDSTRDAFNDGDLDLLQANTTTAESAFAVSPVDLLSNGFKLRHTSANGYINTATDTAIYMAFAENPFKYSNAR
jgi:hypothetical protein